MLEIEPLFLHVNSLKDKYEHIAQITGENFNVFHILELDSNEVHLHSKFLGELLNSKGSHNLGDKFLSLFLKQLKTKEFNDSNQNRLKKFSSSSTKAHVEYYTSKITYDGENGGRIDLLLEDANNNHIIIENKIYARDQPKQLKRYKNFDKNAILIYLNLFGAMPSPDSIGELKVKDDFTIISYSEDIIPWLKECMKEATLFPLIRETLHQYIQLLQKMTNQSTRLIH
ncbi:MAG: PD-(D/E)XK nuclease family protein [Bacteroidia bacterium]|nr:PD-(D/E)XK nuclease family protein [Bacteroidia bacterium]